MMRKLAALLVTCAVALSPEVYALGLGGIKLGSSLNEPLRANIPLLSAKPGDVENLRAALANSDAFRRAGVARPFLLSRIKFHIRSEGEGAPFISVSTQEPMREPFLNFLVEVNWRTGRLVREYTVLLDPPVYGAASSVGVEGAVIRSGDAVSAPMPEVAASDDAPVMTGGPTAATTGQTGPSMTAGDYGPTTSTDTAWSIATRMRPDTSISIQQMMLALVQANPDAFANRNISGLMAGQVLRIPARDEIGVLNQGEALAEVKRHYAAWEEMKGLATAAPQTTTGRMTADGQAQPEVVSTDDDARLRVLSAGAGQSGSGDGSDAELRTELSTALEALDGKSQEVGELSGRLAEAEALVADLRRLVQLKDDHLAALQAGAAAAEGDDMAPEMAAEGETGGAQMPEPAGTLPEPMTEEPVEAMAEPEVAEVLEEPSEAVAEPEAPAAEPEAAKPVERPRPVLPPSEPIEPDSLLDILPAWMLYGGIGLVVVLLAGGAAVAMRRRKAGGEDSAAVAGFDESALDDVTEMAGIDAQTTDVPSADMTEAPAAAEGDAPDTAVLDEVPAEEEEEDPLAEVNVYLAYERFDQAQDLVRKAIEDYPDRDEYKLKILEIHYAAKDVSAFEGDARVLQEAVGEDSPLMEKAAGWWQDLSPNRELFAEGAEVAGLDETQTVLGGQSMNTVQVSADDLAATEQANDLDFDLGFGDEAGEATEDNELDFDLGTETSDAEEGGGDLDFDLGSEAAGEGEAQDSDLDFDLDFGADETAPGAEDVDLDLGLGGDDSATAAPESTEPELTEPESAAEAGAELDFDLGMDEVTDASLVETDTGLDIDLDAGGAGELDAEAPAEAVESDDELDFDLELPADGGSEGEPEAAAEPEAETDSELDFDLELPGDDGSEAEAEAEAEPVAEEPATETEDELDFDLEIPDTAEESGTEPAAAEEAGEDLDFALDLGEGAGAEETEAASSEEVEDIGLELPDAAAEESTDADLDLGSDDAEDLDIGLGDLEAEAAPIEGLDLPESEQAGEDEDALPETVDATDMDLDIGLDLDSESDQEISLDLGDGPGSNETDEDEEILDLGFGMDEAEPAEEVESTLDLELPGDDSDESLSAPELNVGINDTVALDTGELEGGESDAAEDALAGLELPELDTASDQDSDDLDLDLGAGLSDSVDEVATKLDLAQAYIDMGDTDGAKAMLGEVISEGDDEQKQEAETLLSKLG